MLNEKDLTIFCSTNSLVIITTRKLSTVLEYIRLGGKLNPETTLTSCTEHMESRKNDNTVVKEKHYEGSTQSIVKMQADKIGYFNGNPSEWNDLI